MFFQQLIEVCKDTHFSLKESLLKQLQSEGIGANFANLSADSKGIYFKFPNGETRKVLLYQAKIQEAQYRANGDPYVHLCNCSKSLENLNDSNFLVLIQDNLRFSLGIYSHRVQTKIFHEKPLELCLECVKIADFKGDLKAFLKML